MVFVVAYATAYGETLTIAHFPYYTFKVGGVRVHVCVRGRVGRRMSVLLLLLLLVAVFLLLLPATHTFHPLPSEPLPPPLAGPVPHDVPAGGGSLLYCLTCLIKHCLALAASRHPAGSLPHVQCRLPLLRYILLRLLPHVLPHGRTAPGALGSEVQQQAAPVAWQGLGLGRNWRLCTVLPASIAGPAVLRTVTEQLLSCSELQGGWAAALCPGPPCCHCSPTFTPSPFPQCRPTCQAKHYSLWRAVVDALAAGMLVTCLLDFWRIGVGGIVEGAAGGSGGGSGAGLPWLQ